MSKKRPITTSRRTSKDHPAMMAIAANIDSAPSVSHLVARCRREKISGKRNSPVVPITKKKQPMNKKTMAIILVTNAIDPPVPYF